MQVDLTMSAGTVNKECKQFKISSITDANLSVLYLCVDWSLQMMLRFEREYCQK